MTKTAKQIAGDMVDNCVEAYNQGSTVEGSVRKIIPLEELIEVARAGLECEPFMDGEYSGHPTQRRLSEALTKLREKGIEL